MLLLLDWSNYVFALMDTIIDVFMASSAADEARELVQNYNDLRELDVETAKQERHRLEARLHKLLGSHAKGFKNTIHQALRKPQDLLLTFVGSTDNTKDSTDTSTCTSTADELCSILQQQPVQLVAVADAGKRDRWKTPPLVLATAREFGQVLGVSANEFADEVAATVAAAAAPPGSQQEQNEDNLSIQQQEQQQQLQQQLLSSLNGEQQQHTADTQLDLELVYRLKGALLYIARHTLEQGLEPAKPLLIPGCIADEAIAAVVHANAASTQPHLLCIKSDDTDFWQLRCYSTTSGSDGSSGSSDSAAAAANLSDSSSAGVSPTAGALCNPAANHTILEDSTQACSTSAATCTTISSSSASTTTSSRSSSNSSTSPWLFHCGIKYPLTFTSANMPQHHLQKCAILGKGRDELTNYGTVYGPVPAGVEVTDAAGTAIVGHHRPGDKLYREQFTAFDAAARSAEPWALEVPEILQWLQQYSSQVPSIRARFLIKMVQHNINPYNEWSAMSRQLQDTCSKAAAELLASIPSSASSKGSGKGSNIRAIDSSSARSNNSGFSRSGGISASALAAAAGKGGVKPNKKKVVKRRR